MNGLLDLRPSPPAPSCRRCGTGLAASALSCPACASLVHREQLEALAAAAGAAATADDRDTERALWEQARQLVPAGSEQYRALTEKISRVSVEDRPAVRTGSSGRRTRTVAGGAAAVGLLLFGKLKLLLLGLTKLSTLLSMFGFIGVYWSLYGWPLAVGIALSIYIHEMGHVAMLRRLGIRADAPLFIPGVGAMVMLRERVVDPVANAKIGLAGPTWGLAAGVAAWVVYQVTGMPTWYAIAELTGLINLFNLIPIWQLDGARGFDALSTNQRWLIVAASTLCVGITGVGVLWLVAAVGGFRAYRSAAGPGDNATFVTFVGLIAALSWMARTIG
jgi:Zn-dependent protease